MKKTYDETIAEILEQVHTNILAYRYTENFDIDEITDAAKFIDACNWAIIFGGSFKEEIVRVADEVLEEDDDDSDREQDLDH